VFKLLILHVMTQFSGVGQRSVLALYLGCSLEFLLGLWNQSVTTTHARNWQVPLLLPHTPSTEVCCLDKL